MKQSKISLLVMFLSSWPGGAAFALAAGSQYRSVIAKPKASIAKLDPRKAEDLPKILDAVGSALRWKPYELGPLGEGPGSPHPKPLYRTDAFDCTTYVETVMANAYCFRAGAASEKCLEKYMQQIRYAGRKVSFGERNHIPELDWLPNNQRRGYLKDLAESIFPGEWKSTKSYINRALWLRSVGKQLPVGEGQQGGTEVRYLPVAALIKDLDISPEAKAKLKSELGAKAKTDLALTQDELNKEKFRADMAFLRATKAPREEKLAEIPSGTILNLVHAPWRDKSKALITPAITHQGLIVQRADGAHILHAAPNNGHVSDQKLGDYLLRYVRSANYLGISLFQVLPKK